jgi:hypothetical protein
MVPKVCVNTNGDLRGKFAFVCSLFNDSVGDENYIS